MPAVDSVRLIESTLGGSVDGLKEARGWIAPRSSFVCWPGLLTWVTVTTVLRHDPNTASCTGGWRWATAAGRYKEMGEVKAKGKGDADADVLENAAKWFISENVKWIFQLGCVWRLSFFSVIGMDWKIAILGFGEVWRCCQLKNLFCGQIFICWI